MSSEKKKREKRWFYITRTNSVSCVFATMPKEAIEFTRIDQTEVISISSISLRIWQRKTKRKTTAQKPGNLQGSTEI